MVLKLMRGYDQAEPKIELGRLEYDNGVYTWTYSNAKEKYGTDFHPMFFEVPGLRMGEVSTSTELFWYFKDRIPPRGRKDFKKRLEAYGLDEYNEWDFVVAGGLRLLTDTDELIRVEV